MNFKKQVFFPEQPSDIDLPQYLGICNENRFYNFKMETFHLNQDAGQCYGRDEHRHKVFHVVFYRKGHGSFLACGGEHSCSPGLLVMAAPEMPHCFATAPSEHACYHEFTFSLKEGDTPLVLGFDELFDKYFGKKRGKLPFSFQCNEREEFEIDRLFIELCRSLSSFSQDNMFPSLLSAGRLLEYIFRTFYLPGGVSIKEDARMIAARTFIEQNCHRKIYLKDIAAKAGLSREHFCRKFRSEFGVSPLEYALKLRISAARKLLLYSDKTIKQIAGILGFSDEYHFSKTFRSVTGTSPAKFRKNA